MGSRVIDSIDAEILKILRADGRITQRELGAKVGLSPNAAGARVQRLVDRGVITGFHASVDHGLLGRPIEVVIDIRLADGYDFEGLRKIAIADERIVGCDLLAGPIDVRLSGRLSDTDDVKDLLQSIRDVPNVANTECRIVLDHIETSIEPGIDA